jgi:hypothetical protein
MSDPFADGAKNHLNGDPLPMSDPPPMTLRRQAPKRTGPQRARVTPLPMFDWASNACSLEVGEVIPDRPEDPEVSRNRFRPVIRPIAWKASHIRPWDTLRQRIVAAGISLRVVQDIDGWSTLRMPISYSS